MISSGKGIAVFCKSDYDVISKVVHIFSSKVYF